MPVDGNGSESERTLPLKNTLTLAIWKVELQLLPPLVEVNASMLFPRNGTTTVPFGSTRGSAPEPVELSAVPTPALQVKPPSWEVLIWMRPVLNAWSHSE